MKKIISLVLSILMLVGMFSVLPTAGAVESYTAGTEIVVTVLLPNTDSFSAVDATLTYGSTLTYVENSFATPAISEDDIISNDAISGYIYFNASNISTAYDISADHILCTAQFVLTEDVSAIDAAIEIGDICLLNGTALSDVDATTEIVISVPEDPTEAPTATETEVPTVTETEATTATETEETTATETEATTTTETEETTATETEATTATETEETTATETEATTATETEETTATETEATTATETEETTATETEATTATETEATTATETEATTATETEAPTEPETGVRIFGDINLDLVPDEYDEGVYTGKINLDAGTYDFKVKEDGVDHCFGYTFTDSISNIQYYSEYTKATTLNVSGGKYTFKYNTSTNKLTVTYKPYSALVELFGDINIELNSSDGTIFSGYARLNEGSYSFRVNEMGTQMCFGYTFDDCVYNVIYNADYTKETVLNATGGLYSFKFDTSTNSLTVLHTPAGVGDVRIFGDIELNLIKESDTMYSSVVTLQEGSYQFRVDNFGTTYCFCYTFNESIYKIEYKTSWKGATTLNAVTGKYLFKYDISTNQLSVYCFPITNDISIFGDIELALTNTTDNISYSGEITLEAGTYAFRVNEFGTTLCFGGTYTDTINFVYNASYTAATELVATGGTYVFKYNTNTNKLLVYRKS